MAVAELLQFYKPFIRMKVFCKETIKCNLPLEAFLIAVHTASHITETDPLLNSVSNSYCRPTNTKFYKNPFKFFQR